MKVSREIIFCLILATVLPIVIISFLIFQGNISQPLRSFTTENNAVVIEGSPKIWYCDRVLIVTKPYPNISKDLLKEFLNPTADLSKLGNITEPHVVEYSCRPDVGRCSHEGKVCFEHAVEGDGWVIQWGMKYCDTGKKIKANCSMPIACGVYFTGIGCPHCALTDPWLFYEFIPTHPIVVVEYEIYREGKYNGRVMDEYARNYNTIQAVPQIIFDRENIILGDLPILQELESRFAKMKGKCPVVWLNFYFKNK